MNSIAITRSFVWIPRAASVALAVCVALPLDAEGQCTLLLRDSFRLGERPHGGNGNLRDAQIHDGLSGYWPQVPAGVEWISGGPNDGWYFAGSSLDPVEVDPDDPFNGTAFNDSDSVALLPFSPPGGQAAFTMSGETAIPIGIPAEIRFGFTSTAAMVNNFAVDGTLWVAFDGLGQWTVFSNGQSGVVASGTTSFGLLASGWTRIELTYDPATGMASGRVGSASFGPTAVALSKPFAYAGMEGHNFWQVVNNLTVQTGTPMTANVPGLPPVHAGDTLMMTAQTNAGAPSVVQWRRNGWPVADGPLGGSTVSGSTTTTLTITNATAAAEGSYDCVVANACGVGYSNAVELSLVAACSPCDVNCDGSLNPFDIQPFVELLGGSGPAACSQCAGDTDGNGTVNPFDINAFLACLS